MPISNNFILKNIGDEYMIIPLLDGGIDFSKVYNINETGAFIYKLLEENKSIEDISKEMILEYEVSMEEAKADIEAFIKDLRKRGIYHD